MQKFKKGDKVFQVARWSDDGKYLIQMLEIKSWGKQQGTATTTDGEFTKHFISTKEPLEYHPHYLPADTDISEVEAKALELSAKYIERQIRHYDNCVARYSSDIGYIKAIQKDIEKAKSAKPAFFHR